MSTLTHLAHNPELYARAIYLLTVVGGLSFVFVLLGWLADLLAPWLGED